MTAWIVRTGSGAAHSNSGVRRAASRVGGALPGVPGARGVLRAPAVLAGALALLALAGGFGVAHGAGDDGASGAHGAHATGPAAAVPAGGDPGPSDEAVTRGGGFWMRAAGVFSPPGSFVPSEALTYDTVLVPAGARIEVMEYADGAGTRVTARLRGLVPNRAYGMHVHTSPCGADPAAAGPHYQHRPSATADPVNEVWLDFRTDADGAGRAGARHRWGFREGGAGSVIIHDRQGGAGERAACFTVPFGPMRRG
ncbi:superoxide dismutase [Streptomyces sp. WZ.A104]|uniref:superoxide dismutase family protein n=1 Tax=Streptomyces sp. WZ.A104 TaxID=2023771 RepID=UPI000BBC8941|nr:superoxide dismutase family protein [Streptomyces sp. WZ.A104]PCG87844.1 superoxide dismutase [Streptomyces sp. WZ.A104]